MKYSIFLFIQIQFSEQKVFPKSSLGCMYFIKVSLYVFCSTNKQQSMTNEAEWMNSV